jgi:hypothetical protein
MEMLLKKGAEDIHASGCGMTKIPSARKGGAPPG